MPRRPSGGFISIKSAEVDHNYPAKARYAAIRVRQKKADMFAALTYAASLPNDAVELESLLGAVLVRHVTATFLPAYRLLRVGSRMLDFDRINFTSIRMESFNELVRVHDALQMELDWEAYKEDVLPGQSRPRITYDVDSVTALAVWLYRVAQSGTLEAVARGLGLNWHPSQVSAVACAVTDIIYERWHTKIEFDEALMLSQPHLNACAAAIRHKGLVLQGQYGIANVDGVHSCIARPTGEDDRQRSWFDGHHGVSFVVCEAKR